MTLTDALRQTRRFWWLLVLCPLVAGSVAYLVSDASTRVYQAHSTILVEDQPSTDSSTYNDILASERRASTYSRLAESRTVLEAVIQRLNSPLAPDQLAQHVSVAPIQGTQLLTITATAADPEAAAALANAVGQVFIDQTAAQQLASGGTSRDDLQRNIDGVNQNIDTAAARIDELHAGSNVNSASIQAEIAGVQSQLNQLQTTYSTLLEARQRMDITDSQTHAQLRVAEVAAPPREPMSPHVRRSAALGGLVGLLLAAGLALAFGYLDNTVKTADDAHRLLGVTALGDLPALRGPVGLATLTGFEGTEAVRTLRTNLQFALPDRRSRSVLVTSLQPGEGKTTIIANLAVALAQTGQRVVLIDGDLRKPRLHRMFNDLSNRYGLTNLLADAGSDRLKHALQPVHGNNLNLLSAGPMSQTAPDALNSEQLRLVVEQLADLADIVLLDSPPLAVSDALLLAGAVDGVVIVCEAGKTRVTDLARAIADIGRTGAEMLGVVVNRTAASSNGYARYREYYGADDDGDDAVAAGAAPGYQTVAGVARRRK